MSNHAQTMISPHWSVEKLDSPSVEDLIDVFEDRMEHWLLAPAREFSTDCIRQVPGFALALSYFEGIWIYITGADSRGRSKEYFISGFCDVYQNCGASSRIVTRLAGVLYEDARCGLFHDGLFRDRIYFGVIGNGEPFALTVPVVEGKLDEEGEIQSVRVDPWQCLRYIDGHFKRYLGALRDPAQSELRQRFQSICRAKWGYDTPPRVMALE